MASVEADFLALFATLQLRPTLKQSNFPHSCALAFEIEARPGAKHERLERLADGSLKIALRAPPIDGKANEALITALSETFGVPRSHIEITRGQSAKRKRVIITFLFSAKKDITFYKEKFDQQFGIGEHRER